MVSSEDKTDNTMTEVHNEKEEFEKHESSDSGNEKKEKRRKKKKSKGVHHYSHYSHHPTAEEEEITFSNNDDDNSRALSPFFGRILYAPPRKVRTGYTSILFQYNQTPHAATLHQSLHSASNPSSLHHSSHQPSPPHNSSQHPNPLHNSANHPNPQHNSHHSNPLHNSAHHSPPLANQNAHPHPSVHSSHRENYSADCKIEAICRAICDWLNSLKKMNFVIEDISMNLLIVNTPHIWVSLFRDKSTRHYYEKREWAFKLFGKTANISDKNYGHTKSSKVMGDFLTWRLTLAPETPVIKCLSNSPYSSFVFVLYQPIPHTPIIHEDSE